MLQLDACFITLDLLTKCWAGQLGGQEIMNRRVNEPPVYVLAGRVKDLLTGARFGHKNGDWIQRANFKGKRVVKKNSITTL